MGSESDQDDMYRAVGRYFVNFSRLIFHMRHAIEQRLAGSEGIVIPMLALGEAQPHQITNSFFAICDELADFDHEERKVLSRLRNQVLEELNRRNNFAHGDWWIGDPRDGGRAADHPTLGRVKPGRKRLDPFTMHPIAEIDEFSDRLYALYQSVAEFGDICMGRWPLASKFGGKVRVGDVFRCKEDGVVRDGPASKIPASIQYN